MLAYRTRTVQPALKMASPMDYTRKKDYTNRRSLKWIACTQEMGCTSRMLATRMLCIRGTALPEVLLCVWTLEDSMSYAGLWMGSRNCVRKQ